MTYFDPDPLLGSPPVRRRDLITIYKTGDTSKTDATAASDPHLVAPVEASQTYLVDALLLFMGNTTADFKYQFAAPTGAAGLFSSIGMPSTNTTATFPIALNALSSLVALASPVAVGGISTSVASPVFIQGSLVTGTTAGLLELQWAQNAANATATVLKAGSFLRLSRVAS